MTNKPEPNTRAGEVLAADNFKRTGEWPDPTSEMLETVLFDTIWRTIKTWDVNVPHAYSGYMGATGNHVRAIYDAVAPLLTRPLPQPSDTWRDSQFLVATVSQDGREVGIDHPTDANWDDVLRAHISLRDRINERLAENGNCPFKPQPSELEADARTALIATAEAAATHLKRALAAEAQIAKLQADGDKMAGALEQLIKHTTWLESVAPPMCIDGKYMGESLSLADACQALTEWKDRA